ncbi:DeoR/GlpR transcriptional regulator [Arcanobacterium haemolyticum]|nr:DeoR/GlpR transcriptional regulator [Arcanobacterium haemolyticum]
MIPAQRREAILTELKRTPVLSYRELRSLLGVSDMTVRRDIAALEENGLVSTISGGVKAVGRVPFEPARMIKAQHDVEEKQAIARIAAARVQPGMSIYLDAGTTIQTMVASLMSVDGLTIVTNDIDIASALVDHPTAELIVVGGKVDKPNRSIVGRLASATMRELALDLAIISASSWDASRGVTTPADYKVDIKRAAMEVSSASILVAASTKYGSFSSYKIASLSEFDEIITDSQLGAAEQQRVATSVEKLTLAAVEE